MTPPSVDGSHGDTPNNMPDIKRAERERQHEADDASDGHDAQRLAEELRDDVALLRAERDAQAHLAAAQAHDVAQRAVDAEARERERRAREQRERRRAQPILGVLVADALGSGATS